MDYLAMLPVELKIKVFSYLGSFDLIQLKLVYTEWEDVLFDKDLIKSLSFYNDYRLGDEFHNFILKRIRPECVSCLNINGCYWITSDTLQQCIGHLLSLERLYVVETQFTLCELDLFIVNKLHRLQRLAISAKFCYITNNLVGLIHKRIKGLYLHCLVPSEINIIQSLGFLEELWIISSHQEFLEDASSLLYLARTNIKRFVFSGSPSVPYFEDDVYQRICTFNCRRNNTQIYYETPYSPIQNMPNQIWLPRDPNWRIFVDDNNCLLPFGVADCRKLRLNQTTYEEIMFEELNFCHEVSTCWNPLQRTAVGRIILSDNAVKLKKLSFRFCLFAPTATDLTADKPLLRSVRLELQEIVKNCPLIQELEIWDCRNCISTYQISALSSIENLVYLQKLTLSGIPTAINCEFLVDVCKKCKHLSSLRIDSQEQNNVLNYYLCMALPYTQSLNDLRYEQPHPQINKLFDALGRIQNGKLQRLVIKTMKIDMISEKSLKSFLDIHKNLCLVYLHIENIMEPTISFVRNTLKGYTTNRKKIFVVLNKDAVSPSKGDLPKTHLYEMVDLNTFVSVIDIFNGFI